MALLGFSGCRPAEPVAAEAESAGRAAAAIADCEFWEVLHIGGTRVGFGRTAISRHTRQGRPVVRIEGFGRMKFSRAGQEIALETRFSSLEAANGELLEFESRMSQGTTPIQECRGRVAGDVLELSTTTHGKTLSASIPWSADCRGPLASQLSLLHDPMEPGEHRTIKELFPDLNLVGTRQLTAGQYEAVSLLGESQRLLRIETVTTFPDGQHQRGTIWTDQSGDVLRSREEMMNFESFRVPKAVALEQSQRAEFDLVLGIAVKIDAPIARPHQTKRIRYRLHLDGDDPAEVFPSGPSQQVRSIDPHTAEVTVYALRPDSPGNRDAPAEKPGEGDLEPNNMIQSDNPRILDVARQVAGDKPDPWSAALALEREVKSRIASTNYSQAFDTAAEVIETGEGDCTEHAVLLAALARARGIPARVAIGLVYTEESGGPAFGYHMWNEVYIDDRWIPVDATLARGGIGAAHLKLAESNLQGASALSSFLPVAQVAGRLRIEIEQID